MASKILVNLDTSKEIFINSKCKQNDDLILEANIYENGLAKNLTNCSISIQALKADKTYIIQNTDITKNNNKFVANLVKDFTRVAGKTEIEVVLTESSKQNTTFSFCIEVVGSVIKGAVQSSNTVTILENLQDKIEEAGQVKVETEQLIQSGGAATKGDIAQVNSQLEQRVEKSYFNTIMQENINIGVKGVFQNINELKSQKPDGDKGIFITSDNKHWNYWSGSEWVSGGVFQAETLGYGEVSKDNINISMYNDNELATDLLSIKNILPQRREYYELGAISSSGLIEHQNRLRTIEFIPIEQFGKYNLKFNNNNFKVGIYQYGKDKQYLRMTNGTEVFENMELNFEGDVYYLKIVLNPQFSYTGLSNIYIDKLDIEIKTKSIDKITRLTKDINRIDNFIDNVIPLDINCWNYGGLDGQGNETTANIRFRTGFIEIDNVYQYLLKLVYTNFKIMFFEYDSKKQFIRKDANYITSDSYYSFTKQTKYIRILLASNTGTEFKNIECLHDMLIYLKCLNNEKRQYNVMSFNVGYWYDGVTLIPSEEVENQTKLLKKTFFDNDCCICGLQESTLYMNKDKTIKAYDEVLSYRYLEDGFKILEGNNNYQSGLSIASDYPLTDYKYTFYNNKVASDRAYLKTYCILNGKKVCVVTTHLDFNNETNARTLQIQQLINDLKNEKYCIIFGDFNVMTGLQEFEPFVQNGFKLANGGFFGDFDTIDYGNGDKRKLDNIIVSENITINKVWLGQDDFIDHRPLCANISI